MAPVALAGIFLWLAVALGVRNRIHRRRTGASGLMRASWSGSGSARAAATLFALTWLAALAAPLAELGGALAPWWDAQRPSVVALALALYVLGLGGTFGSQLAMGASWRVGLDTARRTELVTSGPYRLVRNPIYSCMLVSALALVVAVPNAVSCAALALMFAGCEVLVRRVEEPHMAAVHGRGYLIWAGRTGRFVPFLGRLREPRA